MYSWISPPPIDRRPGHEVAAEAPAADDEPEHLALRLGDAIAGDERRGRDDHRFPPGGVGVRLRRATPSCTPRTGTDRAAGEGVEARCGGRRPTSARSRRRRRATCRRAASGPASASGAVSSQPGMPGLAAAEGAGAQPAQRDGVVGGLVAVGPAQRHAPGGAVGIDPGRRGALRVLHAPIVPPLAQRPMTRARISNPSGLPGHRSRSAADPRRRRT